MPLVAYLRDLINGMRKEVAVESVMSLSPNPPRLVGWWAMADDAGGSAELDGRSAKSAMSWSLALMMEAVKGVGQLKRSGWFGSAFSSKSAWRRWLSEGWEQHLKMDRMVCLSES